MTDLTASKTQINYILRQRDRAESCGDMPTWTKCQGLCLYFSQRLGIRNIATIMNKAYETVRLWIIDFAASGAKSVIPKKRVGRPRKITKTQMKNLAEQLDKKPCDIGFQGGCWTSALIQELIKKTCGVTYSPKYIPDLLHRMGFSFQRAKFESSHLDPKKRQQWLNQKFPEIVDQAKKTGAYLFFEDESSFAMWGSIFYTWARRGQQPIINTTGKRKALKVFGVIDAFTGRLIYQTLEGRINSESYVMFLSKILRETRKPVIIVHDGAGYHTSKRTAQFTSSKKRLTLFRLPPYSPDFNPIEGLWRNIKKAATHLMYFPSFDDLRSAVDKSLEDLRGKPEGIMKLFGFYRKLKAL